MGYLVSLSVRPGLSCRHHHIVARDKPDEPGGHCIAEPVGRRGAMRPGKPAPVPKRDLQLMAVLGSKAALRVMGCLLVVVVAAMLVLLVTRA